MSVLTRVMARPHDMVALSGQEWDQLLVLARSSRLLARLHGQAEDAGLLQDIPTVAREVLESARIYADYRQLLARRELYHLDELFAHLGFPVVLLKGAAYLLGDVPMGKGRRLNDIDLLVPRARLDEVESLLREMGWDFEEALSDYDDHYYREWSHEIPPLRHVESPLELDLHHNLIQPTSRIKLDASLLFQSLVPVPGTCFSVLAPTDMLLHSATHLFMSDELRGGLRDLVDMHMLVEHSLRQDADFWSALVRRAEQLGLQRPLYYAVSAMRRLLNATVPDEAWRQISSWRPIWPVDSMLRRAIDRHLAPAALQDKSWIAEQLLYLRSHWIRMPPGLLLRHLAYKAWLGLRSRPAGGAVGQ